MRKKIIIGEPTKLELAVMEYEEKFNKEYPYLDINSEEDIINTIKDIKERIKNNKPKDSLKGFEGDIPILY